MNFFEKLLKESALYRRVERNKFNKSLLMRKAYIKQEIKSMADLEFLERRYFIIKEIVKLFPKNSIGVEIGVQKGAVSRIFLSATSPRFLHLVDPWLFMPKYPYEPYGGQEQRSQKDVDDQYHEVKKQMAGKNVRIWRMTSDDFFMAFAKEAAKKSIEKADWVYIDGNHTYDFVLRDLYGASSIIKKGGIIWGDDFNWKMRDKNLNKIKTCAPVKKAVIQFCKENRKRYINIESQFVIL